MRYNNNDATENHGISKPAYHPQLLGNKYRNGHLLHFQYPLELKIISNYRFETFDILCGRNSFRTLTVYHGLKHFE